MINLLKVPRKQRQSREDIHRLLSQARVELCTHWMPSDPMIVAVVYRLLHPGDDDVDPIDMWEADCDNGTTTIACEECATVAELHGVGNLNKADTKRHVGRGEEFHRSKLACSVRSARKCEDNDREAEVVSIWKEAGR